MEITAYSFTFEKGTIICDYDGTQRLDLCKQHIGPINTSLITNAMRCNDKISALLMGANGIGDDDLIKNNNKLSTVFLGCNLIKKYRLKHYKRIDILVNNAATTVRRTPDFYKNIIETEKKALPSHISKQLVIEYQHFTEIHQLSEPLAMEIDNKNKKCIEYNKVDDDKENEDENIINAILGDIGDYDEHSQPIDLRDNNSWTALLGSIHPIEMMETIMVNQFVPFLLINQLICLLSNAKSDNDERSYIVNVSAMEGRFNFFKQGTHPHTNMAKAALNMLTRTSGIKLAKQHNIFMVSVDTGWVTDELPLKRRINSQLFQRKEQKLVNDGRENDKNDFVFHPPLDEIDGASRVLHPIWSGLRGKPFCGVFLKDYRRIDW